MQLSVENTSGRVDYREQVEYAVEYPKTQQRKRWPAYERLKATSNPWPTSTRPDLEATTLQYSAAVCAVADAIRDSLCYALRLDPRAALHDKFFPRRAATTKEGSAADDGEDVPHWVIKLVSYPPAPASSADGDDGGRRQGIGAHTDTNFLTLVLQDASSAHGYNGGLQAYSQGEWIDVVVPSSSADDETTESHRKGDDGDESASRSVDGSSSYLICNLGEQAETWSRGYFLATPHPVLVRPSTAVSSAAPVRRPRTSIPLFYNPALSATMGPLDEGRLRDIRAGGRPAPPWERPRGYVRWRRLRDALLPLVMF